VQIDGTKLHEPRQLNQKLSTFMHIHATSNNPTTPDNSRDGNESTNQVAGYYSSYFLNSFVTFVLGKTLSTAEFFLLTWYRGDICLFLVSPGGYLLD
jgi:hypothetical protein